MRRQQGHISISTRTGSADELVRSLWCSSRFWKLLGAVIAYLAEMALLLALIIAQLASIRYAKSHPKYPPEEEGVGQSWV